LLFLCTQTNPLRIAPVYCFEACAFALQFTPAFLVDLPCLNRSSAFKDSPLRISPVYCFQAYAFALQLTLTFLVDRPYLNRSSAFKDSPLQLAPTRREPIRGGSAAAVLAADGLGNLQQTASCPEQCWYLNL